ncbi:hypothetical protein ALP90_200021 [Pseudomonas amygdali pv. ulmi]|uniref:Uncharacterized protein n=1 Tax=Pseudomonas amygdali pv. ulmi TaxID=251720 RepID=A0A3M4S8H8_PSEA0|nr:hypothetical protein [Pseudomonas amygdali]RMR11237.1 hypothetical protein ALP90_200021 [Pseudomonas amygdali pv. ulmi]
MNNETHAVPELLPLGGEVESKMIKLAVELANRRPLRHLQGLCEREKSIPTEKLIEYVEMSGDTLAAIAIDIRNSVDGHRFQLATAQVAIENLKAELARSESDSREQRAEIDQIKARNSELEAMRCAARNDEHCLPDSDL